jgi:hypothetical protein
MYADGVWDQGAEKKFEPMREEVAGTWKMRMR